MLGPAATQIANAQGLSVANVTATLRSWLNSRQSHLTLSFGYWLVVAGAVLAAGATLAGEVMGRRSSGSPAAAALLV